MKLQVDCYHKTCQFYIFDQYGSNTVYKFDVKSVQSTIKKHLDINGSCLLLNCNARHDIGFASILVSSPYKLPRTPKTLSPSIQITPTSSAKKNLQLNIPWGGGNKNGPSTSVSNLVPICAVILQIKYPT